MVQSLKLHPISLIILLILVFTIGRFTKPAKVEIKEVEKIVKVDSTKKSIVDKSVIVETEERLADGTVKKTKTTYKDKDYAKQIQSKLNSSKESSSKSENLPNNQIGVLYNLHNQSYTVQYQRRLIGSVYLGGYVQTNQFTNGGISLSVGF